MRHKTVYEIDPKFSRYFMYSKLKMMRLELEHKLDFDLTKEYFKKRENWLYCNRTVLYYLLYMVTCLCHIVLSYVGLTNLYRLFSVNENLIT